MKKSLSYLLESALPMAILILLAAFFAFGCAMKYNTPTGTQVHFFLQRGVMLQVVHTCTDKGVLYQAGGVAITILGATPRDVPLDPILFSRAINVTFQSLDPSDKVIATFTQQFYIDPNSTTSETWVISKDSSGGGGGWGGRYSRCP